MACYPCTHCNKCGMYSARAQLLCAECGKELPVGVSSCPDCGSRKIKAVKLAPAPKAKR